MSVLVRNEQTKLLSNFLNALASGTAIGGTLPMFAAWALGNNRPTDAPFFLMIIAFVISAVMFSIARRNLNRLEEPT